MSPLVNSGGDLLYLYKNYYLKQINLKNVCRKIKPTNGKG